MKKIGILLVLLIAASLVMAEAETSDATLPAQKRVGFAVDGGGRNPSTGYQVNPIELINACGDGICDPGEADAGVTCSEATKPCPLMYAEGTCPEDCTGGTSQGKPPVNTCGNGVCDPGEADSSVVCKEPSKGCPGMYAQGTCPQDCNTKGPIKPSTCGNGACEVGEADSTIKCTDSTKPCPAMYAQGSCPQDCKNNAGGTTPGFIGGGGSVKGPYPSDCIIWFDGCNTCNIIDGKPQACTQMACQTLQTPKCIKNKSQTETTTCGDGVCDPQEKNCNTGCSCNEENICACAMLYCESTCPQDCKPAVCPEGCECSADGRMNCPGRPSPSVLIKGGGTVSTSTGKIEITKGEIVAQTTEQISVKNETIVLEKSGKELKVMPDTASETAIEQLGIKYSEIVLKDTGKPVYEVTGEKDVRVLGFIKTRMRVMTQIDAQTGEIVKTNRPWWSFMTTE